METGQFSKLSEELDAYTNTWIYPLTVEDMYEGRMLIAKYYKKL